MATGQGEGKNQNSNQLNYALVGRVFANGLEDRLSYQRLKGEKKST